MTDAPKLLAPQPLKHRHRMALYGRPEATPPIIGRALAAIFVVVVIFAILLALAAFGVFRTR